MGTHSKSHDRWDVIVAGAGLAGLTAGAAAAADGARVLVADGRPPGGRAQTDQVGRFRFNRGAHALYRRTPGRAVLKRLGVDVTGAVPRRRGGLGRRGDQVGLLPAGAVSLACTGLLSGRAKVRALRALSGMVRWRPAELADRTGADWLDDQVGGHEEARQLLETFARTATYVADFDQVSADLVASQLRVAVTADVDYLDGGWQSLVDSLAVALRRSGGDLQVGDKASQVRPDRSGVEVDLGDRTVTAGAVVLATGGPAAGTLLPERPAAWTGLGPPARAACLSLGLSSPPPTQLLFGLDRPLYLLRHDRSARGLAPDDAALVELMRYLGPDEQLSPDQARFELFEHCRAAGIDPHEAEESRYLHNMTVCDGLPQPGNGGLAGRPDVASSGYARVLVAGDWVGPVGHLADASLASGEAAGRRAAGLASRSASVSVSTAAEAGA